MWHRALAVCVLLVAAALVAPPARGDAESIQQAVKQGVACLKGLQAADGSWPTHHAGAAALVGLTLLECDVPASDAAVQGAASYLRNAWTEINDGQTTYAISLVILFLDRLGDSSDTVIIQTLTARLLAGQSPAGGWSYRCPALGADDVRQLRKLLQQQVELKTGGQAATPPARQARDKPALPKEIRQLLTHLQKKEPAGRGEGWLARDDNSNTQFAILGLWAGRRHGVPVEKALARVETHFRTSQHSDGGWSYTSFGGRGGLGFSTPSMTCAGLLGLALGFGSAREATLRTDTKPQSGKASSAKAAVDPTRDRAIRAGLNYLGGVIGRPLDEAPERGLRGGSADMYYLLWSIERVGVAYGMPRIGNKDWYAWGSKILLAAQGQDGGWHGRFGPDIDTSFALLFLRRANLTRDLTSYLKGTPSVNVALKTGLPAGQAPEALERNDADDGENRAATREREETKAGPLTRRSTIPPLNMDAKRGAAGSPEARGQPGVEKNSKPPGQLAPKEESVPGSAAPRKAPDEATRLGADLLKASGQQQDHLLDQLKQGKGVAYTEALAAAIPQLSGAVKTKARAALTERLARMTAFTLHDKLQDDAPEIRRAAALALAMKEEKQAIPDLIALLEDREATVVRASHAALKELTGQDFGPFADAAPEARAKAIAAWKDWWKKQHAK
jgi:hypothetical protein